MKEAVERDNNLHHRRSLESKCGNSQCHQAAPHWHRSGRQQSREYSVNSFQLHHQDGEGVEGDQNVTGRAQFSICMFVFMKIFFRGFKYEYNNKGNNVYFEETVANMRIRFTTVLVEVKSTSKMSINIE
jgi:hypothetical protein